MTPADYAAIVPELEWMADNVPRIGRLLLVFAP